MSGCRCGGGVGDGVLHVGVYEGTEAFHDDVDWSAGMHFGNILESFEDF